MSQNHADNAIQSIALIDNQSDLSRVNDALKDAYDRVRRQAVRAFRKGDVVEFPLKGGKVARGVVDKINQKTVGVEATHIDGKAYEHEWQRQGFNVPPTMLTKVDA